MILRRRACLRVCRVARFGCRVLLWGTTVLLCGSCVVPYPAMSRSHTAWRAPARTRHPQRISPVHPDVCIIQHCSLVYFLYSLGPPSISKAPIRSGGVAATRPYLLNHTINNRSDSIGNSSSVSTCLLDGPWSSQKIRQSRATKGRHDLIVLWKV